MIANFQPPATSSWPKLSISVYEGGEYKLTLNETCYSEKYNKQISLCGSKYRGTHSYTEVKLYFLYSHPVMD